MNQIYNSSNPSLSLHQPLHTRSNKRLLLKVSLENWERDSTDKNMCFAFLGCCFIYFHIPFMTQLAVARKITMTIVCCSLLPSPSPPAWWVRPEDPKTGVELIKVQISHLNRFRSRQQSCFWPRYPPQKCCMNRSASSYTLKIQNLFLHSITNWKNKEPVSSKKASAS